MRISSKCKVSVIIPAYNMEKYVAESLESIVRQTLTDIQIICVNDGSTDGTLEILNDFALKDERIIVFSQDNRGLSAARNSGLDIATSEYIYFFDSDDILVDNGLEILYNHAKRTNSKHVLFDGITFFDSTELEEKFSHFNNSYNYQRSRDYPGVYKGDELYPLMVDNQDYYTTALLQFFEREYLQENDLKFKFGILHEDNLFTLQALLLCPRVSHLRLNLFRRRIRENSIMTTPYNVKHFEGYYNVTTELIQFLISNKHRISDSAILAAKQQLVNLHRNMYHKQKSLPTEQQYQPQFPEPILQLISEIVYLPFVYREQEERKHKDELGKREKAYQSAMAQKLKEYTADINIYKKKNVTIRKQLESKYSHIRALEHELKCLKQSKSFKFGRAVTFIPRKLRGFVMRIRSDGFLNTVRYAVRLVFSRGEV